MPKFSFLKNKKFKHGSIATLMTVGFVAVVVLVNILASMLVERFDLNLDITSDKVFSLSEQSIAFTEEIQEDIRVYVLIKESELVNAGDYFNQANEIIKRYAQYSSRINVEYVDLTAQPTFANKYANATEASVVVESSKRYKVLALEDLYEVGYDYSGNTVINSSIAEQAMTGALMYVTNAELVTATFVSGHGEMHDSTALSSLLGANNYEVETVELRTQELNQDSQFVIICAPTSDYMETEIEKLDAYLDNDGQLGRNIIYIASPDTSEEMPNLDAFLADWGIDVGKGWLVETDASNRIYSNDSTTLFSMVVDETYSTGLDTDQLWTITPRTRPVNPLFESDGNRTVSTLMQTFDTVVFAGFDIDETWSSEDELQQSYITAVVCEKTMTGTGSENITSRIFAFGTPYIFDPTFTAESSIANGDYFVSIVNTISDKEEDLQIVPKTLGGTTFEMSESASNMWAITFVFLVPIALLAAGIIIWVMRKNR